MSLTFVNLSLSSIGTTGAGSTTVSAVMHGFIEAIYVDYDASADAGTDLTIDVPGQGLQSKTVMVLTDTNTDGWFYPRELACDATGTAHDPEQPVKIPVFGNIRATVAQAGTTVYAISITVFYSE